MAKPILSICIPNYNRADFLAKNLAAIGPQAGKHIEIIVSDNASTEDIKGVIKKFKAKFPRVKIRLNRNRTNIGFDRNVVKVVSLARGQYCWLLSNDDKILPGSVEKITKVIRQQPALILVNYRRFDQRLKKITASRMINIRKDRLFNSADEFFFLPIPNSYFKIIGLNTLTMSCNVFRRQWWIDTYSEIHKYLGHNFIHVFALTTLIKWHPHIYFISQPQLQYLANNHRTWANLIWTDFRQYVISHMFYLGYNPNNLKLLKKQLKQNEINERFLIIGQRSGLYFRLFPYIRKIRHWLGHHI